MVSPPATRPFARHDGRRSAWAVLAVAAAAMLAACSTPGEENAKVAPDAKASNAFAVPDWVKAGTGSKSITTARAITPDDLIGADGSCAATRVAAVEAPASESDAGSSHPAAMAAARPGPTVIGGIALAMTECDVAQRAGYPGNVEIGSEAGGERSVVLTYREGPWPGIYRFRGGRLVSIERVEVIEPPKAKKPAKRAKPPTQVNLRRSAPQ